MNPSRTLMCGNAAWERSAPVTSGARISRAFGPLIAIVAYCSVIEVNRAFKYIQTASASLMAISHGQNDAQKTMGIILLALVTAGHLPKTADVPLWVKLSCAVVMGLGTMAGGKRIIKTMGMKITELRPADGFAAETAASCVLLATGHLGFPVSTTHVITASIMGVGAAKRWSALKWPVVERILWAWVFTLPVSAVIAYLFVKVVGVF